ncbi:YajC [gut metagenome]|uniref:YajC n=1 Tax=gut metagenome TaxID=749906 RepID=J9FPJ6_9ZZZZ
MNLLTISLLQAAGNPNNSPIPTIIMIVAMFAIVYFFMIRPQNKKQKEIQNFRNSLQTGQNVVTIGGIHGTIKSIDEAEGTLMLEIATGVKIKVEKSAIAPLEQK